MTPVTKPTFCAGRAGFAIASAALILVMLVPLLAVNVPPINDVLGHMGRYAVQTRLADTPSMQAYYSFHWQAIGNLGADLLVQMLHPLFGVETSVRIIVILAQLLGTAGILAISRQVYGRISPFAIAALPLLYGYPFNFGLLNFVLSMALALLVFATWLRLRSGGKGWAAPVWLAIAGALVWLCHTFGWAFLGLLCGSTALADAIKGKLRPVPLVLHVLGECWPLLLPLAPMLLWRAETSGSLTNSWSLNLKGRWIASALRATSFGVDVVSLQLLLLFAYWAVRSKWRSLDLGLGLAALFCCLAFLALPARVFGSFFADMRLVPYAIVIGLLAIAPSRFPVRTLRWMTVLAVVFLIGRIAVTTATYVERERTLNAALQTIDSLPQGVRLAAFVVQPCEGEWEVPLLWHVGSMAIVRKDAFANDQWQDPGVNLIKVHYPAAGKFADDPSQLVQRDDCAHPIYPRLSTSLAKLPRAAFTRVWLIGDVPDNLPQYPGLEPLPHPGAGVLYAVK